MHKEYAHALYTASQEEGADAHKIVQSLVAVLRSEGREKLLPSILREVSRIEERAAKLAPLLEIASEEERSAAQKEAAAAGVVTSTIKVNPDLISGWRASGNGKLIDSSGKRALVELYRSVTRN